jgi:stage V sporulation protein S
MQPLRVSAKSRVPAVAGAIAAVIRETGRAEVQAIGAGAVNQAAKAVAIARLYLAAEGVEIVCIPTFVDVQVGEAERTAINLIVETR